MDYACELTQKRKALEVLTAGQELETNLIPVQTFDDYLEIRDLCRALRIWPPVTVLIEHIGRVDTGKLVQVAARRGHGPMKPMSFVMMHLTYDELCPQPIPSVKVDLQSHKPPAKTTIRITAPSHYRKSFLPIKTQDDISIVISETATWQKGPLSALTGGTWAWSTIGKSEQLVGHLRVSPALAKILTAQSGTKGIFVTETQVHQRSKRARCLPKEKSGEAEHYLRSSPEFARRSAAGSQILHGRRK